MKYFMKPNKPSNGLRSLREYTGIRLAKEEGRSLEGHTLINWGNSRINRRYDTADRVVNHPDLIAPCINKLTFFRDIINDRRDLIPDWDTSINSLYERIGRGSKVVARSILTGHSGQGITIIPPNNQDLTIIPEDVKLFVQYIPKKEEYRVHVFGDRVLSVDRKVLHTSRMQEPLSWEVRSYNNGFTFMRNVPNPGVAAFALMCHRITGLDFGAYDIIYNKKQNRYYLLEVNTAPGLEGQTIELYGDAINEL